MKGLWCQLFFGQAHIDFSFMQETGKNPCMCMLSAMIKLPSIGLTLSVFNLVEDLIALNWDRWLQHELLFSCASHSFIYMVIYATTPWPWSPVVWRLSHMSHCLISIRETLLQNHGKGDSRRSNNWKGDLYWLSVEWRRRMRRRRRYPDSTVNDVGIAFAIMGVSRLTDIASAVIFRIILFSKEEG